MSRSRAIRSITCLGLVGALMALIAGGVSLWQETGQPWSSIPTFSTGFVGPRILAPPESYPLLQEVVPQTRILRIDGREVANAGEINEALQNRLPRMPTLYEFETVDGEHLQIRLPLQFFDLEAALRIYLPLMALGILFVVAGVVPVLAQPQLPAARALAAMVIGLASNFAFLLPDYFLAYRLTPWSFVYGFIGVAALLHFALLFPRPIWPMARWPRSTLCAIYGGSAIFWLAFAISFERNHTLLLALENVEVGILAAGLALLIGNLVSALLTGDSRIRRQSYLILPGVGLFAVVAVILAGTAWGVLDIYIPPIFYFAPIPLIVIALSFGMLSGELFALDRFARRLLGRGTIVLVLLTMFCVLLACLSLLLEPVGAWAAAAFLTLLVTSVLPIITPIYTRLEDGIEVALFPQRRHLRRSLQIVAREIGRLRDSESLVTYLRDAISPALDGAKLRVVAGETSSVLSEIAPPPGTMRLDLRPGEPLHEAICSGRGIFPGPGRNSRAPKSAAADARKLGIELLVPLATHDGWVGGLLVRARPDGRPYQSADGELVESLAGPVGIAIENARRLDEIDSLRRRLEGENLYLRTEVEQTFEGSEIVGESESIREVISQLHRVAEADVSVLIVGETGTGKELAVRTLHGASDRADRVLVKLACGALPESLLETELFGHERGAFTGADRSREGRFEIADGGMLFFDDVDTLSLGVQAKLLRAIQEGEVQRLGSNEIRHVDVRIVAATNCDLEEEVRAGRFREDLYYRLAVVPIRLPPLRERRSDIPLLVEHLIRTEGKRLGRSVTEVDADAIAAMKAYDWPGNVRELRNVVERAIVLEKGPTLRLSGPLGKENLGSGSSPIAATPDTVADAQLGSAPLQQLLRDYKKALITAALRRGEGNQRKAAETLGLHRPSLTRMIKDLGVSGDGEPPSPTSRNDEVGKGSR